MSQRFVNKTVVITGASAGIGAAAARAFAAEGGNLVLVARGADALGAIVAELAQTTSAIAVPTDVADLDAARAVFERAEAEFGAIHVLVNNAAANCRGDIENYSPAELARVVAVNLGAPIALSRMVLPYLRTAGGGAIVNVASLAGRVPLVGEAVYSATKFGLRAFTFAMAEELAGSGITMSAVSPGPVDTGFITSDAEIDIVPDLVFSQPMSSPEQIAALILACAADGKIERTRPRLGGYLSTLGYLAPSLRRLLVPFMERHGRKVKERYRRQRSA